MNNLNNQIISQLAKDESLYEIKPETIIQNFSYFDTKISYSEEFLCTFFGVQFFKELIKEKNEMEDILEILEKNFVEVIEEGFNDVQQVMYRTKDMFGKESETDYLYCNYILVLENKK